MNPRCIFLRAIFFLLILILPSVSFAIDPIPDRRGETLIIYNTNAVDAEEIAVYYAAQRNIPVEQICPLELPTGLYANRTEFLGARKTLIECICELLGGEAPSPCNGDTVHQLREVSPYSHMAIIRGIPARLTNLNIPNDAEEPSFDYFFSHAAYRLEEELFDPGVSTALVFQQPQSYSRSNGFTNNTVNPMSTAAQGYVEAIDPSIYGHMVYGRIEAMTKEQTFLMIDRTLEAEAQGFRGNILDNGIPRTSSGTGDLTIHESNQASFLRDLLDARDESCVQYLIAGNQGDWPHTECAYGAQRNGKVPGSGAGIPRALGVGYYAGFNPWGNGQVGFNNNFETMKNWHKSEFDCVELCSDFPTTQEQDACRNTSTDIFKELNTECVGTGAGAIGNQVRSYPVQHQGIFPFGWRKEVSGAREGTPPVRVENSNEAFTNERFRDPYFIRFGDTSIEDSPTCTDQFGSQFTCQERIPISLTRVQSLGATLQSEDLNHTFKVRVRHPANSTGATLRTQIKVLAPGASACNRIFNATHSTSSASDGWRELSITVNDFNLGQIERPSKCADTSPFAFSQLEVLLVSRLNHSLRNYLDVDGAELTNNNTEQQHISASLGGFAARYLGALSSGDWASQWINRLGGIAFWGSSSHYQTGGWAFSRTLQTLGAFFSGRSLGESVYLSSRAMSGIAYGDPLYSPSAVKLFARVSGEPRVAYAATFSDEDAFYSSARLLTITEDEPETLEAQLFANVFHGRGKTSETRWALHHCENRIPAHCQDEDFTLISSGAGVGMELPVLGQTLGEYFAGSEEERRVSFRLTVYNPGEEEHQLRSYAHVQYRLSTAGQTVPLSSVIQNVQALNDGTTFSFRQNSPGNEGGVNIVSPFFSAFFLNGLEITFVHPLIAEEARFSLYGVNGESYELQKTLDRGRVQLTLPSMLTTPESLVLSVSWGELFRGGIAPGDIFFAVYPGDLAPPFGEFNGEDLTLLSSIIEEDGIMTGFNTGLPRVNRLFDFNLDQEVNSLDRDFMEALLNGGEWILPSFTQECNDENDNDGDELVDLDDPDCESPLDSSEENQDEDPLTPPNPPEGDGDDEGELPRSLVSIVDWDGDLLSEITLVNGGTLTILNSIGEREREVSVSLNGRTLREKETPIAMDSNGSGLTELYVVSRRKNRLVRLTHHESNGTRSATRARTLKRASQDLILGCDLNSDQQIDPTFLMNRRTVLAFTTDGKIRYRLKRPIRKRQVKEMVCLNGNSETPPRLAILQGRLGSPRVRLRTFELNGKALTLRTNHLVPGALGLIALQESNEPGAAIGVLVANSDSESARFDILQDQEFFTALSELPLTDELSYERILDDKGVLRNIVLLKDDNAQQLEAWDLLSGEAIFRYTLPSELGKLRLFKAQGRLRLQ